MSTAAAGLKRELLAEMRAILGAEGVVTDPGSLLVYESDGLTAYRTTPAAVLLPRDTEEVSRVLRLLTRENLPFVARGAGTGLSGGAVAIQGSVIIGGARMRRILRLDAENRRAVVQPGVVNVELSAAAAPYGLYYAPDPSSQTVCTIGGNVAENAGGPHCLKYGTTVNHVIGLTVVLPSGDVVRLGGGGGEHGVDLVGLFVGSEGTFGIATEVEVRLLPLPQSVATLLALFDDVDAACHVVSEVIAAGLLPAALEMVDRQAIRAVEASAYAAGLPDVAGALVIEFDGTPAAVRADADRAEAVCRAFGAREVQRATEEAERQRLWYARKKAFGAMGRIAPDLLVQDAVVPRSRLPETMRRIYEIAAEHGIRMCNMFHAGDGNLHPTLVFDRRDEAEIRRVESASRAMMRVCVEAGGSITGEHGIGIDKREYMEMIFSDEEMALMCDVRRVFDPTLRANPAKVLPIRTCREWIGPATRRIGAA
jgi:glycolate oxidase subunit GlcD